MFFAAKPIAANRCPSNGNWESAVGIFDHMHVIPERREAARRESVTHHLRGMDTGLATIARPSGPAFGGPNDKLRRA